MDISSILTLAVLAATLVYAITVYNALVQIKHNVAKAWANIDVLLRQRHDELPKLVETCQQYMKFEQDTLAKVIEARSQVFSASETKNLPALGRAETGLRSALGSLFALAEAYPELKANQTFQQLQTRISALENAIADRREFYNESVNINNVRIEQFPDLVIARLLGFPAAQLLEFSTEDKKDVDVRQLFNA